MELYYNKQSAFDQYTLLVSPVENVQLLSDGLFVRDTQFFVVLSPDTITPHGTTWTNLPANQCRMTLVSGAPLIQYRTDHPKSPVVSISSFGGQDICKC
nr:hypothetical protein BgiMline_028273 [Biomphalaria glabrata]